MTTSVAHVHILCVFVATALRFMYKPYDFSCSCKHVVSFVAAGGHVQTL